MGNGGGIAALVQAESEGHLLVIVVASLGSDDGNTAKSHIQSPLSPSHQHRVVLAWYQTRDLSSCCFASLTSSTLFMIRVFFYWSSPLLPSGEVEVGRRVGRIMGGEKEETRRREDSSLALSTARLEGTRMMGGQHQRIMMNDGPS